MKKRLYKASFFQKIVLPALLAILLFIMSVFAFIIPVFEENVMDEKREMLHELTNTAWSILSKYHEDAVNGLISHETAQKEAIKGIESLRYGKDRKDYFWITDMQPVMIMHPYVHELNGKSLQDFADPDGTKLFMEALKIAQSKGEGFISYRWQFKDDSTLIVPKLSFVKRFTPWNWIIGTGIYMDDVQTEITALTKKLIFISIAIILIISLIIFFITHQSLKIERSRKSAETQLHESREKYRSLIESSTEGIILLLNNKISYSNLFIQNWLGYSNEEILNYNINDLFYSLPFVSFESIKEETRLEVILNKNDNSKAEAVLTILPVYFADKRGLLLTFRDTSESRSVKNELENLKSRLHNISSYSNLCLFTFSMQNKIKLIDFNARLISMLGYKNEEELKNAPFIKILAAKSDMKYILKELSEKQNITNKTLPLKRKDGTVFDAILSLILIKDERGKIDSCDGIIEVASSQSIQTENENLQDIIATAIARSNQYVDELKNNIVSCPYDTPLIEAIELMNSQKSEFILIMNNKDCMGFLTFKDIVSRYFKSDYNVNIPVYKFMNSPVIYIDSKAKISDAYTVIKNQNISYLVIKNNAGGLIGVFDWYNIKSTYLDPQELLFKAIDHCMNIYDLSILRKQIPKLIKPLLNETGSTRTLNKLISLYNDAITDKVIQIALKETGPAPVQFTFIAIGSAAREELVLNSDQDNACIFKDSDTIPTEELQNYFLSLSEKVCRYLDESGLMLCKGDYMAQNKKWCQPLSVWKEYFAEWIINSDATSLLNISVFFDFRHIYGEKIIFTDLEDYIFEILNGRSAFFFNLAQSIAGFKPPLNVFGNIITESSGKNPETLDIKNCLASVIMFVRIYSLHYGIRKTGTIERINELYNKEILSSSTVEELIFHFNFMMQLRIKHQLDQILKNIEPDNLISPKKLTDIEQIILKKVFSQMNGYQAKLAANFMSSFNN